MKIFKQNKIINILGDMEFFGNANQDLFKKVLW